MPADLVVLRPQQGRARVEHRLQGGCGDVPVDPVLDRLGLWHGNEHPVRERQTGNVLEPVIRRTGPTPEVSADHTGPPASLLLRLRRVDHQLHYSERRDVLTSEPAELTALRVLHHSPVLLLRLSILYGPARCFQVGDR